MKQGTVFSADLHEAVKEVVVTIRDPDGVLIHQSRSEDGGWVLYKGEPGWLVSFSAREYCEKIYRFDELPDVVRLLEKQLVAYQNSLWFKPGDEIRVFVHSPADYTGTLYRHGLYKEKILDIGDRPKQIQQVPDAKFVDQGLDWEQSFVYRVPKTARPGIYSLKLVAKNGDIFAVPMVISSAGKRQSDLLVLASTNTWQSYNIWGGRSRYRNNEDKKTSDFISPTRLLMIRIGDTVAGMLPDSAIDWIKRVMGYKPPAWKFKKLTIKRPYTNCLLEGDDVYQPFTNHLASTEWRFLAWLKLS